MYYCVHGISIRYTRVTSMCLSILVYDYAQGRYI